MYCRVGRCAGPGDASDGLQETCGTVAATAETAESAATDETAATPNPVEALPASVTVGTVLPKTEAAGRSYIDETLLSVTPTPRVT